MMMKTADTAAMPLERGNASAPRGNMPARRTCRCGHTRDHAEVQQEPQYTLWGWIILSMFGMTPSPECIVFRCIRCKQSLGSSRDPALLHKKQMPHRPANSLGAGAAPSPEVTAEVDDSPKA